MAFDKTSERSESEPLAQTMSQQDSINILQQSNDRIHLAKTRRINKALTLLSASSCSNEVDTNFSSNHENNNSRLKMFDTSINGPDWRKFRPNYR